MYKIKGVVKQIITPKEIERGDYIFKNEEVIEPGKYLVYIETEEFSKQSFFKKIRKRFMYHSKKIDEMNAWSVIVDEINFKEGDIVEFEVMPIQTFSGFFEAIQ